MADLEKRAMGRNEMLDEVRGRINGSESFGEQSWRDRVCIVIEKYKVPPETTANAEAIKSPPVCGDIFAKGTEKEGPGPCTLPDRHEGLHESAYGHAWGPGLTFDLLLGKSE